MPRMRSDNRLMTPQRLRTVPVVRPNGGIRVDLPFDPSVAWDGRDTFHVSGTIGGHLFRGPLRRGSPWTVELGPVHSSRWPASPPQSRPRLADGLAQRPRLPASGRTSIGSPIASLTRDAHSSAASRSVASIR